MRICGSFFFLVQVHRRDNMTAYLVLEDGSIFPGEHFGAERDVFCEIVFNTSMTGYLEIITDPSYAGQGIVMTYPLIGNYGVNPEDAENDRPMAECLIIHELSEIASNYRSKETLAHYMERYGMPGIQGINTRQLTILLRNHGTMNGLLTTNPDNLQTTRLPDLIKRIQAYDGPGTALRRLDERAAGIRSKQNDYRKSAGPQIALIDFGAKKNIGKMLEQHGCTVTVFGHHLRAEAILESVPSFDGILLSNGPGDPKRYREAIAAAEKLMQHDIPIFGICLGHQILALAAGGNTAKLKYGHRGANHPVKDLETGRIYITSQNHGYMVDGSSLDPRTAVVSHINVNDGTVEGIRYLGKMIFSVQYHPEACAGPLDSVYLFDTFLNNIQRYMEQKRGGAAI